MIYRPGQPNWESTMWKYQDSSATHISHEINFCHFEAHNTTILSIWAALNYECLDIFVIFKCKIPKKSKFKANVKMAVFDPWNQPKLLSHKIKMAAKWLISTLEYQHSKFPIRLPRSVDLFEKEQLILKITNKFPEGIVLKMCQAYDHQMSNWSFWKKRGRSKIASRLWFPLLLSAKVP